MIRYQASTNQRGTQTIFLQCRHRINTLLSSYFLARISSMSISYGVSSYSIDSSVWSICFSFAPVIKSPMTCRKFLRCKDELKIWLTITLSMMDLLYTSRTHSSKKANLPNLVVLSPSYRHPFQSLSLTLLSWKTIPPRLLKPTSDKPFENEHWGRNSQVVEMHMPWIAKKILNCEKFDTLHNPCL